MRNYVAVAVVVAVAAAVASSQATTSVTVADWRRTIDLSTQLVKVTDVITFEASANTDSVIYTVEKKFAGNVAFIGASSSSSSERRTYLRVSPSTLAGSDASVYKIDLREPVKAGGKVDVTVELVLAKALEMYPKEISQKEKQQVLFVGNHYAYTPYKVKSQTTKVTLPNSNVESYSKNLKPVAQNDKTITYGPYSNAEAFTEDSMTIHYENNNAFLIVKRMERLVEVSMWGNIAIEETIDMHHAGAKLRGSFSRYEFQRENSGVSSVKSFKTLLPAAATDVYYRDDIGNISTSALRSLDEAVEVELRPRFPLFGGWKTHYTLGYNVPSYEYLFQKGDQYALSMRLVDHIHDDMLIEELVVKVILPEGAKVGKWNIPYPTTRLPDGLHYTYLDYNGRPIVTLKNVGYLTEKHIQDFQLEFTYPRSAMIQEPALLMMAYFIFFFLTIIYVRLDFAITKDESARPSR